MNPAWSWALMGVGAFGLLLGIRGVWWGWLVNVCAQGAWLVYGLTTGQPGFVVSACIYSAVYVHGVRRARAGGARGGPSARAVRAHDARARCARTNCRVCAWARKRGV